MADYNYDSFGVDHYDLADFKGPRPGQKAPDFEVDSVGGDRRHLLDFDTDFLVLEMGSITCPLFQGRRPGMERLRRNLPDVSHVVLYVREAHPGSSIPAHVTQQDKQQCAQRLIDEDGELRSVLVDDIDGSVHAAYGGYPNSVFIINRHGYVVYCSDWNNPAATTRALSDLRKGQPAQRRAYFKPAFPWIVLRTLHRGGRGAMTDFFAGLPSLIWRNIVLRGLRITRNRPDGVEPDIHSDDPHDNNSWTPL